jgi:hypothetical protein
MRTASGLDCRTLLGIHQPGERPLPRAARFIDLVVERSRVCKHSVLLCIGARSCRITIGETEWFICSKSIQRFL